MGDKHFEKMAARCTKFVGQNSDLSRRDSAVLKSCRSRGICAKDHQLIILKDRVQVGRDVMSVPAERREDAPDDVAKGDVVISRHHQTGNRDLPDECAGCFKLLLSGALGQIAADDNHARMKSGDILQQSFYNPLVCHPKMEVRNVRNHPHGIAISGANTRNALGRIR